MFKNKNSLKQKLNKKHFVVHTSYMNLLFSLFFFLNQTDLSISLVFKSLEKMEKKSYSLTFVWISSLILIGKIYIFFSSSLSTNQSIDDLWG